MLDAGDIAVMHGALAQLSNATLTAIQTPGPLATNGDPGAPVPTWTGTAEGFLERETRSVLSQGAEIDVDVDTFIIYEAAGAPIESLAAGPDWSASTVVISDERQPTPVLRRFSVVACERQADGTLDHVKLTLNNETVVS